MKSSLVGVFLSLWHNIAMSKKTNVVFHWRKGRPVRAHERSVSSENTQNQKTHPLAKNLSTAVRDIAEEEILEGEIFTNKMFTSPNTFSIRGGKKYRRVERCHFRQIYFEGVDLSNIEFVDCTFENNTFQDVNLNDTNFKNCQFVKTDFVGRRESGEKEWEHYPFFAENKNTVFENCNFSSSQMKLIQLFSPLFSECKADGFEMVAVKIFEGEFRKCQFQKLDLKYVDLFGANFNECSIKGATLYRLNENVLSNSEVPSLAGGSLSHPLQITRSSLEKVVATESSLNDAQILESQIDQSEFKSVNMFNVVWQESQVGESHFRSCGMNDSKFYNSSFGQVTFESSHFWGSEWNESRFSCDFVGYAQLPSYGRYSLGDALKESGLTEKQFEFLVLSGGIEVRDNVTMKKISSGFDQEKHHVPPWTFSNLKSLSANLAGEHQKSVEFVSSKDK